MPAAPTPTAPRSGSALTRRGEATAERILDAAEALFAERGFAGTTLRDVAGAVGIRIPSLYNHFASKEALYSAVLERGIGPVLAALASFAEEGPDSYRDPGPLVARVMELLSARPHLPQLVGYETLSGGRHLTTLLRDWIAPTFSRAATMIEQGAAPGRFPPEQIPLLVLALYHVVVGYFTIAPFYAQLDGEDLLAPAALERQTRLVVRLSEMLFAPEDRS